MHSRHGWSTSFRVQRLISLLLMLCIVGGLLPACGRESLPHEPQPTPATLDVQPTDLSLPPGGSHEFVARLIDERGEVVPVAVAWEATGGTIDADGYYTAGQVAGTYEVRARAQLSESVETRADAPDSLMRGVPVIVGESKAPEGTILPGQDIQAIVDSNPPGTTFFLGSGIHRLQSVSPRDGDVFLGMPGAVLSGAKLLTVFEREGPYWVAPGQTQESRSHGECDGDYTACAFNEQLFFDDVPLLQVDDLADVVSGAWYFDYAADRIYFVDNPQGHTVETSVTDFAFRSSASNVTIESLVVEKYANRAQAGAITSREGLSWTILDSEIRLNHGVGLYLGSGSRASGNYVHHNGQMGVGAFGSDILFENNEISFNNTAHFAAGWEAGGSKFALTDNLVVRSNHVHNNYGPGLWTDIDNINTLYVGNEVHDNETGIFHEISYDAVIRDNNIYHNGVAPKWLFAAGIQIVNSRNVEIFGNTLTDNANGITGIEQNRGSGAYGPHILMNLAVYDNVIWMRGQAVTGIGQDTGDGSIFTSRGNWFDRNTYYLDAEKHFMFANERLDADGWVGYGQDVNGEFNDYGR